MTDNTKDRLLMHHGIGDLDVVIYVPDEKIRKKGLRTELLKESVPLIRKAISVAEKDPFSAMTINGRAIASASGIDDSWADTALEYGALGAGVSGSGPAIAAVFNCGEARDFIETCGKGCIVTATRDARVLMLPETGEDR